MNDLGKTVLISSGHSEHNNDRKNECNSEIKFIDSQINNREEPAADVFLEANDTTLIDNGVSIYIVCTGNNKKRIVDKSVFSMGSSPNSDFVVNGNPTVSRNHAKIILEDDGCFYIRDNNSSNGTFIEGIKAKPNVNYKLFSGSRFLLSNEEFIFVIN